MEKNKIGESFRNSFRGVVRPSAHADNIKMRGGHMFLMIVLMSLFIALTALAGFAGSHDFLDENWSNLPAFVFEDGELSVEGRMILPLTEMNTPTLLIIDTNVDDSIDTSTQQEMVGEALKLMAEQAKCSQVLFLGRHNIMVWANWQMRGVPYTVFIPNQAVNNETAKPLLHRLLNISMAFFAGFMFVFMIVIYYICVLLYSLVGLIFNLILKTDATFEDVYKISLSAAFPMWIVKQLVTVTRVKAVTMYSGRIFRVIILLYIFFALMAKGRAEKEQKEAQAAGNAGGSFGSGIDEQINSYGSEDNYHF